MGRTKGAKHAKFTNVALTIQANQNPSPTDKENLISWATGLIGPMLAEYKEGCLILRNPKHGTVVIGWEPKEWARKAPKDAQIVTEVKT